MIQTSKTVMNYSRLLKKAKVYKDQSIVIKIAKMKMLVQVNQCLTENLTHHKKIQIKSNSE